MRKKNYEVRSTFCLYKIYRWKLSIRELVKKIQDKDVYKVLHTFI